MASNDNHRSLNEVEQILGWAKLSKAEVMSTTQCLYFAPDLDIESVKLMEVNNDILECLQSGQRLTIRGSKKDSAVLCTHGKTFDIKEAETSNNLLILPDCNTPEGFISDAENLTITHKQICATKQVYYEIKPMRPKLKMLTTLLENDPYDPSVHSRSSDEQTEGETTKHHTMQDIKNVVQASDLEIKEHLKMLDAILVNGCYRMIAFDFIGTAIEAIVQVVDSESMSLDAIPMKTICDILEDLHSREAVAHVLKCYSKPMNNNQDENSQDDLSQDVREYKLDEDKVCRYYAKMLLRTVDKFLLNDFLKSWQLSVPEGMVTDLSQLKGLALADTESSPNVIKLFSVQDLPEDTEERFNALFREKPKWTMEEILPYIKDLETAKIKASTLLTKNTRTSTQSGIKMFSSKKPL